MSQSPGCRQEIFIIGKYAHKKKKKKKKMTVQCAKEKVPGKTSAVNRKCSTKFIG